MHGSDGHGLARRRRASRRLRVALYSSDVEGPEQARRNLAIARALAGSAQAPDLLLVTGAPQVAASDLPPRTDCLTLPELRAAPDGSFSARLDAPMAVRVRSEAIAGALAAFDPDLLIVDGLPGGAGNELVPALTRRRSSGGRTVLGLPDVLDAPSPAMWEWQRSGATQTVARHYDAVWVYGDPRVCDPITEYRLPEEVRAKVRYTGYLAPPVARPLRPAPDLVLCLVGGGGHGHAVGQVFLQSELPDGAMALLVTGPDMPAGQRDHLERIAAQRGNRQVRQLVGDTLELLAHAQAVVASGDYTAVCEILAAGLPAFIVPRTASRQDERIRAARLQALGVVECCSAQALDAAGLTQWIARAVCHGRTSGAVIGTGGLATVSELAAHLCGRSPGSWAAPAHEPSHSGGRPGPDAVVLPSGVV